VYDNVHRFTHEDIEGAVIRVLDDEIVSINEFLPAEEKLDRPGEFRLAYTCCYLRHRGTHVLVDAGFDPDTVPGALESIDVSPEEIEWVLLTHADRDHAGGLLRQDRSFTYPNAQHVIGHDLWEALCRPETLDSLDDERGPFYRRLVDAFDEHLQLYVEESEIVDGVRFVPNPGHRIGHAVYEFAAAKSPLLHTGDAFMHAIFVEQPGRSNRIDTDADQAAVSRVRLVERAAASNALVLATHIPFPGMGRIERSGGTTRWEPVR